MKTREEYLAAAEALEWAADQETVCSGHIAARVVLANRAKELRDQASQVPEQEPVYWEITCNGEPVENVYFDRTDAVKAMDKLNAEHSQDVRFVRPLFALQLQDKPAPTEHTAADAPNREAGGSTTVDAASTSAVGVPDVEGLLENFPEINPSNYGDYEVMVLNRWGLEAYDALAALQAMCKGMAAEGDAMEKLNDQKDEQIGEMRELLRDFRNNYEFGDEVDRKIDAVLERTK